MKQEIYELLIEMNDRLKNVEMTTVRMDNRLETVEKTTTKMNNRLVTVDKTVTRIEQQQVSDVIGLMKVTKKKIDFETDYLNDKVMELDKRLYKVEKNIEN